MGTFRVVRQYSELVPTLRTEVLAETDDPIEAHVIAHDWIGRHPREKSYVPTIEGEHPTHEWGAERCSKCHSPRGGCIRSHMPCGRESHGPLINEMNAWRDSHAARAEES